MADDKFKTRAEACAFAQELNDKYTAASVVAMKRDGVWIVSMVNKVTGRETLIEGRPHWMRLQTIKGARANIHTPHEVLGRD